VSRILILLYGIVSYAIGMGGLTCFILFIGGWEFLPLHIDFRSPGPLGVALLINVGLMVLFTFQHTVMARRGFKKAWTKVLPHVSERSTYVLLSGVMLVVISYFWQPIEGTVWQVKNQAIQIILIAVQMLGWCMVVTATFLINHFELFGLQRVYCNYLDKPEPPPDFTERSLYKIVRHPLQLGLLIGLWTTPTMSMSHLMLSATMTIYIFIGLYYEEKDLIATLGPPYEDYRKRVRMLIPIPKRKPSHA
jgi:protein-S-isoprenylcysteine O-methyltransferase Ste14